MREIIWITQKLILSTIFNQGQKNVNNIKDKIK